MEGLGGSTECSIANSLWTDPEGRMQEDFVGRCSGIFDAQVFQEDLSAPVIVPALNSWVSDHTAGMIPQIIQRPFGEDAAALMVNALYLKNTWAAKFDPSDTVTRDFTRADGVAGAPGLPPALLPLSDLSPKRQRRRRPPPL